MAFNMHAGLGKNPAGFREVCHFDWDGAFVEQCRMQCINGIYRRFTIYMVTFVFDSGSVHLSHVHVCQRQIVEHCTLI